MAKIDLRGPPPPKDAIAYHRRYARKHAELAAKYANEKNYEEASRWYRSAAYHSAVAAGVRYMTK